MNGMGDDLTLNTSLKVWDGWANSPHEENSQRSKEDQGMPGWKEFTSESSKGEKYYYHAESNTSQWEAPPGWGGRGEEGVHSRLSSASSTLPMPANKPVVL